MQSIIETKSASDASVASTSSSLFDESEVSQASVAPARWWYRVLAPRTVAVVLAVWCTVLLNQALLRKLGSLPDFVDPTWSKRIAILGLVGCATYLWLMLWSWPRVRRAAWSVSLVLAAVVQFYMLHYGMVMDGNMVRNILQTNFTEGLALFSPGLLLHVLLLAGIPILWLYRGVEFKAERRVRAWLLSVLLAGVALGVLAAGGVAMYRQLAPLLRNHTEIRFMVNPLATVVSFADVTLKPIIKPKRPFRSISEGAALGASYAATAGAAMHKPPLLVLVVGETTRGDHFGLNGYPRNTTPELEARHVVSWRNVHSCGTNTLASVPCMFSPLGKSGYEHRKFEYGTLVDVIKAAGLGVEWLDNQAGCKGVCDRIHYAQADQVASPALVEKWCKEGECLDQLMADLLDQRLAALPPEARQRGAVLVLHQMGSHGPAYYRRSSAATKAFQPECTTHVTSDCSHAELVNVYDNSMRETDLFNARVIDWLKQQEGQYETAMMYVADHGESLGENGIYLHGLPYAIAPEAQTHIPWVLWPGSLMGRTGVNMQCVRGTIDRPLNHDSYFHTVLGMVDVHSPQYKPELDLFQPCRQAS